MMPSSATIPPRTIPFGVTTFPLRRTSVIARSLLRIYMAMVASVATVTVGSGARQARRAPRAPTASSFARCVHRLDGAAGGLLAHVDDKNRDPPRGTFNGRRTPDPAAARNN